MPPKESDFNAELDRIFAAAAALNLSYIGLTSGELHRRVGSYPGDHRMPVCCRSMRRKFDSHAGDRVIASPEKGDGATLLIQYVIPRRA